MFPNPFHSTPTEYQWGHIFFNPHPGELHPDSEFFKNRATSPALSHLYNLIISSNSSTKMQTLTFDSTYCFITNPTSHSSFYIITDYTLNLSGREKLPSITTY
jgi:hypothetical protein